MLYFRAQFLNCEHKCAPGWLCQTPPAQTIKKIQFPAELSMCPLTFFPAWLDTESSEIWPSIVLGRCKRQQADRQSTAEVTTNPGGRMDTWAPGLLVQPSLCPQQVIFPVPSSGKGADLLQWLPRSRRIEFFFKINVPKNKASPPPHCPGPVPLTLGLGHYSPASGLPPGPSGAEWPQGGPRPKNAGFVPAG